MGESFRLAVLFIWFVHRFPLVHHAYILHDFPCLVRDDPQPLPPPFSLERITTVQQPGVWMPLGMKGFLLHLLLFTNMLAACRSFSFHPLSAHRWCRLSTKCFSSTASDLTEFANPGNTRDQVFSAMSSDGSVKVSACTTRNLMNDICLAHAMSPTSAEALGRASISALLMSNGMQDEQMVQLTFNVDGPIGGIVAIANGKGEVRGYAANPALDDMPLRKAVGKGALQVVKNHPSWKRPYNGITAVQYGDIDRDVGGYLAKSEQRTCVLSAATTFREILCTGAGGYLVERLPNANDETIEKIHQNIVALMDKDGTNQHPATLLHQGMSPLELSEQLLDGLGMTPLQQIEPKFHCPCTSDRLIRAIRLLSPEEVNEILDTEKKIEAKCEFCGTVYRMTENEVREELAQATGDPALDSDFNPSKQ
eukprot:Nitzschia sp. Nitz4//scaffold308_size21609//13123//14556//NITZ4_008603-RA/size21609-augustus-gene-0.42-mRNA-1//1//CDS//3329547155//3987//frame0